MSRRLVGSLWRWVLVAALSSVLATVCAIVPPTVSAGSSATVSLASSASVVPGTVHLGDIAGLTCADASLKARLEAVVLGPSPVPGMTRRIRKDYIILRIRQQRIDPAQVHLEGPEVIELSLRAGDAPQPLALAPTAPGAVGVTRGQLITIKALAGPVSILTTGKTLEAASVGQVVKVTLTGTGRIVAAVVADGDSAVIEME